MEEIRRMLAMAFEKLSTMKNRGQHQREWILMKDAA